MEIKFDGKTAVVTGAGKGIGRELSKTLVKCGANVIALSRTQSDLDSLKLESPSIQIHQIDLGKWDETRKLCEQLGPVDMLINNAGVARSDHFFDAKKEDLDETFDVNVKAIVNVSQVLAKSMVERGTGGAIVNISSISSTMAAADIGIYCASKSAVDMLTKWMAMELGPHKIRVNSINPTVTWTQLAQEAWKDPVAFGALKARIPMGKTVEIVDVVNAIVFLLSDKSAMCNGMALVIDGGLSIH